jgi:hypothetical protein
VLVEADDVVGDHGARNREKRGGGLRARKGNREVRGEARKHRNTARAPSHHSPWKKLAKT